MIEVDFNLISKAKALEIANALLGRPTENRVVLAVDVKEKKTQSGLFIPGTEEKELPRKGVIVAKGVLNDDPIHESLKIGEVVQYGMYGGKEIYPAFTKEVEGAKDLKYFVLSSSEVIYIEPNTKD